jgi:hypothetical protein
MWFSPLPLSPRCSLAPPDHTESLADQGYKLKMMLTLIFHLSMLLRSPAVKAQGTHPSQLS